MQTPLSVAVLGAGSWGTALAALIARHGHQAVLWGRDAPTIEAIGARHENPRYLPGVALPPSLRATTELATAMRGADLVLVVVPSHAFTETRHALAAIPYQRRQETATLRAGCLPAAGNGPESPIHGH